MNKKSLGTRTSLLDLDNYLKITEYLGFQTAKTNSQFPPPPSPPPGTYESKFGNKIKIKMKKSLPAIPKKKNAEVGLSGSTCIWVGRFYLHQLNADDGRFISSYPKASVEVFFGTYLSHLGDPIEGGEIGELEPTPADSSPGAGGLLLQVGCHASRGDTSIEPSGG